MPNLPNYSTAAKKRGSWLNRRALLLGAASAAGAAGFPDMALQAATWRPSRPVHVFIGYPAGGAVDTVVRLVNSGRSCKAVAVPKGAAPGPLSVPWT
jgi:hypothetical protein